ncbi:Hypothetical protein CAP_7336 [Chondromyces apiculatus DSM 436]|uniref:Uncharacterized protein n=1 Tax=Chondromyces apiculatus DSM 436 TaxID=1192034 RepID=A0A017SZ40_9BACT|nr:Hypothetical protein CAP_7336 [Chondromyces apiculatus DSM 436]
MHRSSCLVCEIGRGTSPETPPCPARRRCIILFVSDETGDMFCRHPTVKAAISGGILSPSPQPVPMLPTSPVRTHEGAKDCRHHPGLCT